MKSTLIIPLLPFTLTLAPPHFIPHANNPPIPYHKAVSVPAVELNTIPTAAEIFQAKDVENIAATEDATAIDVAEFATTTESTAEYMSYGDYADAVYDNYNVVADANVDVNGNGITAYNTRQYLELLSCYLYDRTQ